MKVKLTTDRAGERWVQAAGEILDLPRREALALIKAGQAEPIDGEKLADDKGKA